MFVDRNGQRVAYAPNLNHPEVAGYQIDVQVFGWGNLYMPFRPPVSTTLRAFTATPFDIHSGLQAHDPTTYTSPKRDAHSLVSNPGAQQFITAALKDRGGVRAPTKTGLPGISLDDPDRDGYCEEISEGDLDVAEWYLLNHPAPTRGRQTADTQAGERLFTKIGCATCHVPDWRLLPANPNAKDYTQKFDGDRRFFDLKVAFNEKTERLEGKVEYLTNTVIDKKGLRKVPKRGAYTIRGIFSDFKYHDVGEDFYQMQFDGSIVKKWKTSPLWGIGHTAPYAHDGANLDLNSVIRRHGGEALDVRVNYTQLSAKEQDQLICFLNSLVLYQTDQLPCDINGDGKIDENFKVQGMNTGLECFNPEFMFRVPVKIEGPIRNIRGEKIISRAGVNIRQAYGLDLEFLKDTDGDGFPDVIDPEPLIRGYRRRHTLSRSTTDCPDGRWKSVCHSFFPSVLSVLSVVNCGLTLTMKHAALGQIIRVCENAQYSGNDWLRVAYLAFVVTASRIRFSRLCSSVPCQLKTTRARQLRGFDGQGHEWLSERIDYLGVAGAGSKSHDQIL